MGSDYLFSRVLDQICSKLIKEQSNPKNAQAFSKMLRSFENMLGFRYNIWGMIGVNML